MMKKMIEYQEKQELFAFIANLHAMTSLPEGSVLAANTREAAAGFLALGLDPDKSVFWVQSDVLEVTELTWVLSNLTPMGLLERCHSYKDKVAKGIGANHGLFAYPVLMSADILLYQSERVPVGKDQKQHLEVTRDVAASFHATYGEEVFVLPEPLILDDVAVVPGVDGRKMSKSYDNNIEIFGPEKPIRKKIMGIVTDSTPVEAPKPTEDNALYQLLKIFAPDEAEKAWVETAFAEGGVGYGDMKKRLFEYYLQTFGEARARYDELRSDPSELERILHNGADTARETAAPLMDEVRKAVGIR